MSTTTASETDLDSYPTSSSLKDVASLSGANEEEEYASGGESLTLGSVSDNLPEDYTYDSEYDVASKNLVQYSIGAEDDEESMSAAVLKAKKLVEAKLIINKVPVDTRVKVLKTLGASAAVKVGDQVIVDSAGACINKNWAENQTLDAAQKQAVLYQTYYLGPLTRNRAADLCNTRSQWYLFHQIEQSLSSAAASVSDRSQLPSAAPLFIVYRRNDNGQHEFYQIRSKPQLPSYYVDYGDPEAPKFSSIYSLIKFYNGYAHVNVIDARNRLSEVFPLWKRPAPVPTISEYSAVSTEYDWLPSDSVFDATTVSGSSSSSTSLSSTNSSIKDGETDVDF